MKSILSISILFFLSTTIFSQTNYRLSGSVRDGKTNEIILGGNISIMELSGTGTISSEDGSYSITLPKGNYTLLTSYLGYSTDTLKITLVADKDQTIKLLTSENQINEVVIYSQAANENIKTAQTGFEKIDIKALNKLPSLLGERDVLKSMSLLPGIKSAGEGTGGLNIRGGADNENLVLLDGAPVYNASHLLGLSSVFNSDAISEASIYKGTQPAQYGSRLSSVVDVKSKIGNYRNYSASGSLGVLSTRLSAEGPIIKDKASFFVSARHNFFFYDINARMNFMIGKKDAISISGYYGRDHLNVLKSIGINWGNSIATLHWNHTFNEKTSSLFSVIFNNYDYKLALKNGESTTKIKSGIRDYSFKGEVKYSPLISHTLRFGWNSIFHAIAPGAVSSASDNEQYTITLQRRYSFENALYASDEWKATSWLNVNYGIRLASFSVMGSGDFYNLNANNEVTSATPYKKAQVVKTYYHIEPRVSANFMVNENISIKTSYNRNSQDLHLIASTASGSPIDKWIPSNNNIKPAVADQVSVGYFQNVHNNMFEFSIEGYYKHMNHIIDYKDGANVQFTDAIETQLLSGKGRAYGIEMMFRKKIGKFTGWMAYTYSKTEKKIDGINNSNWYAARQDHTHDFSIVLMYDITRKINVSGTWVYNTGNAVTYPSGKYLVDGQYVGLYTERNGYRMPSYHRLDLAATFKLKERKHFTNELSFGVYNTYARPNAYSITFRQNKDDPNKAEAVRTSIFTALPFISWNFKIF